MPMPEAATQQINLRVTPLVYRNVLARAQAMGLPAGGYAKLLFEAAYSARIGREKQLPVADAELDEQVRAVFCLAGEFDTAAIARTLGLTETFVAKVLDGWRQQRRLKPGKKAASP